MILSRRTDWAHTSASIPKFCRPTVFALAHVADAASVTWSPFSFNACWAICSDRRDQERLAFWACSVRGCSAWLEMVVISYLISSNLSQRNVGGILTIAAMDRRQRVLQT